MDKPAAVNKWKIVGYSALLWLALQVLLRVLGDGWVVENMVIRAVFGLVVSVCFAVRMGRLTEMRWGIILVIVALFAVLLPFVTEACLIGYFAWASHRLAREEAGASAAGNDGAGDRLFLRIRLWSLLLWGLMSLGIALAAGVWGGFLGSLKVGDRMAWETFAYVFDGLMLFWLLQKLEQADVGVEEFIGRQPGIRMVGEGLLLLIIAEVFAGGVTDGLIYLIAGYDASLAEDILKSLADQLPPTNWRLEQFLGVVVFGPLVEELVFRGLVLRRLAARWGSTAAIIVSSLAFGVPHADAAVGATIFGVAMALLYFRSQTLVVPILAHMANNLVAYLMLWYWPDYMTSTLEKLYAGMGFSMLTLGLAAPVMGYCFYMYWPRRQATWPMVGSIGVGGKV
jgi:membrane protease YdiL (CAAX protease family)